MLSALPVTVVAMLILRYAHKDVTVGSQHCFSI